MSGRCTRCAAAGLLCYLLAVACVERPPCSAAASAAAPLDRVAVAPANDAPGSDGDARDRQRELPPVAVSAAWLARGRQRYDIMCAVCHGRVGDGLSLVAQAGLRPAPANLHSDRLRQLPLGSFFVVATRGTAAMPAFGAWLDAGDRWAIATYVRTLQLSQDADVGLIPTAVRLDHGWDP